MYHEFSHIPISKDTYNFRGRRDSTVVGFPLRRGVLDITFFDNVYQ